MPANHWKPAFFTPRGGGDARQGVIWAEQPSHVRPTSAESSARDANPVDSELGVKCGDATPTSDIGVVRRVVGASSVYVADGSA